LGKTKPRTEFVLTVRDSVQGVIFLLLLVHDSWLEVDPHLPCMGRLAMGVVTLEVGDIDLAVLAHRATDGIVRIAAGAVDRDVVVCVHDSIHSSKRMVERAPLFGLLNRTQNHPAHPTEHYGHCQSNDNNVLPHHGLLCRLCRRIQCLLYTITLYMSSLFYPLNPHYFACSGVGNLL
jgi:hypothetical protein